MEGDSQHFFSAFSLRVLTFCSVLPSLPLLCSKSHQNLLQGGGGGILRIVGNTGRVCPKGAPFLNSQYTKG